MTHYIILKFKEGSYTKELYELTNVSFTEIVDKITGVNGFKLFENTYDRDINGDLMIMVELETKEMLQVYLDHPLHVAYIHKIKDILVSKMGLDC